MGVTELQGSQGSGAQPPLLLPSLPWQCSALHPWETSGGQDVGVLGWVLGQQWGDLMHTGLGYKELGSCGALF